MAGGQAKTKEVVEAEAEAEAAPGYEFLTGVELWRNIAARLYQKEQEAAGLELNLAVTKGEIALLKSSLEGLPKDDDFDPAMAVGAARRQQAEARRAARQPM